MKKDIIVDRTLGKRLREFRDGRGLTRKQLGKLIGVNPQTIFFWEKMQHQPSLETLKSISNSPIGKCLVGIFLMKTGRM